MRIQDRLQPILKLLKIASVYCGSGLFVAYHIRQTRNSINKIVNSQVQDKEKKQTAEYIYIEDASYNLAMMLEENQKSSRSVGLTRIWKSLKNSLAWRLLWLCKHGNNEQRNIALQQLAAFKNNKVWHCYKLAQAMDKNTAVLLARTRGADLRYFLPPPIHVRRAALTRELLSFKLRDLILEAQAVNPHSCIRHFLSKYFANVQEQAMESDTIPTKPDSISERDLCLLCLDALHHHITLFHNAEYAEDISTKTLIEMGLLSKLAEVMLRYQNDTDLDVAVLRILTVLSVHSRLLQDFFQNGLIGDLARFLRSQNVRLSSSAAVCLANLSGEFCYQPGLFLLYPIYRTSARPACDMLLVHGLRGGVFVTWRQRDKKCMTEPVGIIDGTISDVDCEPCEEKPIHPFIDAEYGEVMEDLLEIEDEVLLSEYEVVLEDLPIDAKREVSSTISLSEYTSKKKRIALIEEEQDRCYHTFCWPKDWLPKDCNNLRILGVNYWSSLSEWLERCPLQTADIAVRAAELAPALVDAEVGKGSTPIVWLAHSMGGLITKQVLVDAAQTDNSNFKKVSDNTRAVFFYSTPHKGSSLATMPRAAAAILWPSNDVRQLRENSPELLELQNKFIKFADILNWETISFAETMPTLVTAFKVPIHFVELKSADLGRGAFYQLPLDHLSICKPATRQSILYTTVLDVLKKVTTKEAECNQSNPIIQYIVNFFWWLFRRKAKEMWETIDETSNSDRLPWFERILLEAFTDGFSD